MPFYGSLLRKFPLATSESPFGGEGGKIRQVADAVLCFYNSVELTLTQSLSSIIKRNWKLKWKSSGGESNPDRLGESPERIPLDHYGLIKVSGLKYLFKAALWCMYVNYPRPRMRKRPWRLIRTFKKAEKEWGYFLCIWIDKRTRRGGQKSPWRLPFTSKRP